MRFRIILILETNDHIFRVENLGSRRTTVVVYEVSSYLIDDTISSLYASICRDNSMLYMTLYAVVEARDNDIKIFCFIRNWLDLEGRRFPLIVTGRKPAWRLCGEIVHLSPNCPRKKTSENVSIYIQNFLSTPKPKDKNLLL